MGTSNIDREFLGLIEQGQSMIGENIDLVGCMEDLRVKLCYVDLPNQESVISDIQLPRNGKLLLITGKSRREATEVLFSDFEMAVHNAIADCIKMVNYR